MTVSLQKYRIIVIMAVITLFWGDCRKNNNTTTITGTMPAIVSLSVAGALANSAISIYGTNFSAVVANNTVTFNGITAKVNSASATEIVVTVPANATTGKIILTTNGTTLAYATDFNVLTMTKSTDFNGFQSFRNLSYMSADVAGNVYCSLGSDTIYKITPLSVVTAFGIIGANKTVVGGTAADAAGNIYVVDETEFKICKITPAGVVSTLAGNGVSGFADGQGAAAQFVSPIGLAIDKQGNLFVTDVFRIRKITPAGLVSTLAGSGVSGSADGQGTAASFGTLYGIAIDAAGNIFTCDQHVRKITPAGITTTLPAFDVMFAFGIPGYAVDASDNIYTSVYDGTHDNPVTYNKLGVSFVASPVADFYSATFDSSGSVYYSYSSGSYRPNIIAKYIIK